MANLPKSTPARTQHEFGPPVTHGRIGASNIATLQGPEAEILSDLIGQIYDASLDPSLWVNTLQKIANFVGGSAASLYTKDVANKTADVAYQFGLDPRYVELYVRKYVKLDPTSLGYFIADMEEPVCTADVMPYDEFIETRFYKEWGKPQGLVDTVQAMLEKSLTSAAAFVVFRHERNGLVNDETRRRMRIVLPHIRRAVLISKVLDLQQKEAATLAATLDGINAGMLLIDATGRIVHTNAPGQRILERGDMLRALGGRLVAKDPTAGQTLSEIFTSAGNGDTAIGIKGIALPLEADDGDRYVAHVLPLTSGARRRAGISYRAVAALFVHRAALEIPSPPEAIAKAYKLTAMELRVLLAVVEVGGVPEVAEALGIAKTTVKTHLGHLYEKTSASRQADLVKLVAGFSNPLLG